MMGREHETHVCDGTDMGMFMEAALNLAEHRRDYHNYRGSLFNLVSDILRASMKLLVGQTPPDSLLYPLVAQTFDNMGRRDDLPKLIVEAYDKDDWGMFAPANRRLN